MTTGQVVLQTRSKRVCTSTTSSKEGGKPFSTPDTMSEVAERLKNYANRFLIRLAGLIVAILVFDLLLTLSKTCKEVFSNLVKKPYYLADNLAKNLVNNLAINLIVNYPRFESVGLRKRRPG